MEETVALLAMNGSSKSVVSLKKAQRASQNSARTKMGTVNEASENRRIKEKAAEVELEKAVEFWKGIHELHGPPDLAPSDCRECADIARTIGDSKIHPKITSTLDRFPRIASPPREPEILAPEVPQAMRDSLARRGNPDSTKPNPPPRPSRIPRPARLGTIVERSSSSEDSQRETPARPPEPVQEYSVFESDSEDEEDDNEELSTLSRTFLSRSTLDLTLLDEVRRDYLAQRPPSPTSPLVSSPTDTEEATIAPTTSEELDIPLLSPSSAEGQEVIANIREYFSLPHNIPFSEIPGRLDALAGYLINDRTVVPRNWEQRFDIGMRAGEADIVNRRIVEDWIKSINWYEGHEETEDEEEQIPAAIPAILRPVAPRHLNPDLDTSGLRQTETPSPQTVEEGDSPDLTGNGGLPALPDSDSESGSDDESPIVRPPRLYNIMTRPRNSERGFAHRPARSSILRNEVVVFDSETVERVRKYKW
jgi:hypothetical protein